jgi:hypothetical protein
MFDGRQGDILLLSDLVKLHEICSTALSNERARYNHDNIAGLGQAFQLQSALDLTNARVGLLD